MMSLCIITKTLVSHTALCLELSWFFAALSHSQQNRCNWWTTWAMTCVIGCFGCPAGHAGQLHILSSSVVYSKYGYSSKYGSRIKHMMLHTPG
jgi:hypothetical protein